MVELWSIPDLFCLCWYTSWPGSIILVQYFLNYSQNFLQKNYCIHSSRNILSSLRIYKLGSGNSLFSYVNISHMIFSGPSLSFPVWVSGPLSKMCEVSRLRCGSRQVLMHHCLQFWWWPTGRNDRKMFYSPTTPETHNSKDFSPLWCIPV